MEAPITNATTTVADAEFDRAFEQFRSLLNLDQINALQPRGPSAIYTALVTVWLLVYQRLHAGRSLADAVAELVQCDPSLLPHNRRLVEGTLSSNTGAYSRARTRLKPEVTDWLAQHVFDTIIAATPPSLGDRRVFLLDGTTITLAPTAALKAAYPPATNQHGVSVWPVAHLLVAHELASGCAILPELGPKFGVEAMSEMQLTKALLPRIPVHSVLLADRAFGVFAVAYAAQQAQHDVVFRLTEVRFRALQRQAKLLDDEGTSRRWQLNWTPSARERKRHTELPRDASVSVWLHELVISPTLTLWLVTTLDAKASVLDQLYRRRIDVETDIRELKVTLRTEELRATTVAMLRKELATSLVAYNLVVQVRQLAAQVVQVPSRRLSYTGVLGAVKIVLFEHSLTTGAEWRRAFKLVLRIAGQRKLPNRPGRSYPRVAYPRRSKSNSGTKKTQGLKPK